MAADLDDQVQAFGPRRLDGRYTFAAANALVINVRDAPDSRRAPTRNDPCTTRGDRRKRLWTSGKPRPASNVGRRTAFAAGPLPGSEARR